MAAEQHVWVPKYLNATLNECVYCRAEKDSPREDEIGLCETALRRSLIHDVGEEMAANRKPYQTQSVDSSGRFFSKYAEELVADVGFAGEVIQTALGSNPDTYKGPVMAEVFKEIRAERRRMQPIDGMVRLEQAVYVEIETDDSK